MAQEVTGLHGVVLISPNYEEQVRFYRDVLGLAIHSQYEDATFFAVGEQLLAVFGRGHHPEGTKRLGGAKHGLSHLEFQVETKKRAEVERRLDVEGARAYRDNFQDADGNLFHFV